VTAHTSGAPEHGDHEIPRQVMAAEVDARRHELLDLGRPDRVSLIFARRIFKGRKNPTPGVFRTQVITQHVTPSLNVDYKHTTIKRYHKEGQALRTETTINDTYDFEIGRRLANLPALR
jgi:hypothetical protein